MPEHTSAEEVVRLLVELVRNACVNDGTAESGNEHRSVATLQRFFDNEGIVVEPHPGRQSVFYRVPGSISGAPALMLIPHLDVVPADARHWTHPPFDGVIDAGFVWGRGTLDMLNVTAAMAAVFQPYLSGSLPPLPGDLAFVGVADEEAGGKYGAQYLVEERWDLVSCDYLLTEVAAPPFRSSSATIIPVTVAEKGPAWRRLHTRGVPGHASQPYGKQNALVSLAAAMGLLGTEPVPVLITSEWRALVEALPVEERLKADLVDPDRVDAAIDLLAMSDPAFARWVHACTHLTISPTTIRSGVKANVIPDEGFGDVDIRLLPGQDDESIHDHFRKSLGPAGYEQIDVTPILDFPANGSEAAGPLWEAIADAAERVTGTRALIPSMTPVTTDARFFRAKGVPAYGVGWFDDKMTFGEMLSAFHGIDERVSVDSVGMTARFLADVVDSFATRTAP